MLLVLHLLLVLPLRRQRVVEVLIDRDRVPQPPRQCERTD